MQDYSKRDIEWIFGVNYESWEQAQRQTKECNHMQDSPQWHPTGDELEVAYRPTLLREIIFKGTERDDSEGESWCGQVSYAYDHYR